MRKILVSILLFLLFFTLSSQRRMENLGRGLVASKISNGVYVNWRIPAQEWRNVSYNLYRDGAKINASPITGASNFVDASGTLTSKYKVAAVVNGLEQPAGAEVSVLPNPWIDIDLKPIPKISGVDDKYYKYTSNDIVTGDLDGDGEYDFIVKRYNNQHDSADPYGNKYYTLFDAYKSDGTFMWRIDVGPNLISHEEINALVYDFDGDGKAEVVMRTSEGTVDGIGNVIPDLGNAMGQPYPDGKTNYRDGLQMNNSWFEYSGPEYLSLFDGETGVMLDRIDHIARQPVAQWGGSGMNAAQLAHRATKYHYGAPYLDGVKPSVLITRGIYDRIKMEAYDVAGKKFVKRWAKGFDSSDYPGYAGQGNHNYSIADVDNDGRDEIIYASMTVDDDGKGLYTTGLGHGDALHVSDLDPFRKGLEVFACHENSPYWGTTFRAAESGAILHNYIHGSDCGRCMAANVSNKYKGAELNPTTQGNSVGGSVNFRIYWDGDLLEELVDHNNFSTATGKGVGKVQKYNDATSTWSDVLVTTGYYSNNYTKGTPSLQADIIGDWREELIFKSDDESRIRIYFSTHPTAHRIYTLMHDMQYRQAIAWQMCGYNQPPHTSFFLGEAEGILLPPQAVISNDKLLYAGSNKWTKNGLPANYSNDDELLFDVSGHGAPVVLNGTLSPKSLTVNSPQDYTFDTSSALFGGSMIFVKQGNGTLTWSGTHEYHGATELWDGLTIFEGSISNSPVWINRFAEFSAKGILGAGLEMEFGSILYPGGKDEAGVLNIGSDLNLKSGAVLEFELNSNTGLSDKINITGNLDIGTVIFQVKKNAELTPGNYILMQAASIMGNAASVTIEGLDDQIFSLSFAEGNVVLSVEKMRSAASVLWKGDKPGAVWEIGSVRNFTLNDADVYFALGDEVIFDDSAVSKIVNKSGNLPAGNITVNSTSNYVIQGSGVIKGDGSLLKTGTGSLTLRGTNEYTGATLINGGTLIVENMPNLGRPGSVGFPSGDPEKFVIDGAVLSTTGGSVTSTRALKAKNATINANASINWEENISGPKLTKTGMSSLNLFTKNLLLDTLVIVQGTLSLATEGANETPARTIVMEGGVLQTLDGSGSYSSSNWNLVVPQGKTASVNLDSRCVYTGKLTGAGILNVKSPYVRCDQNGNWTEFTGTINFSGENIRLNNINTQNLSNASVNLASGTSLYVASNGSGEAATGVNLSFGALSGTGSVSGRNNIIIGDKNTNSTYSGVITTGSGRLTKRGTGQLTLSGNNLYTGGTDVNTGVLIAANTAGSAFGTGSVTVKDGALLSNKGFISGGVTAQSGGRVSGIKNYGGNVTIAVGGFLEPGDESSLSWISRLGTLTLDKSLLLNGTLKMGIRNASGYMSDKLVVKGNFTVNGNFVLEIVNGAESFPLGTKLTLLDLTSATVSGSFTSFDLPPTDSETEWDTSKLLTEGILEVVKSTSTGRTNASTINIYPNPAKDFIRIEMTSGGIFDADILDINGKTVIKTKVEGGIINVSELPQGIYLLHINQNGKLYSTRFVK